MLVIGFGQLILNPDIKFGWLGKLGFIDFAGSSVVHSVGGWVALAILLIIGNRTGRFREGKKLFKEAILHLRHLVQSFYGLVGLGLMVVQMVQWILEFH